MPDLVWGQSDRAKVRSVEDLDRLVDQLTSEASEGLPFAVELYIRDGTGMYIVVGRQESHVEFFSAHSHPPVIGCRGPWDDDDLVEFTYRGQYSELPKRFTVPISDAREALRRFFQTGKRPDNIAWNDSRLTAGSTTDCS